MKKILTITLYCCLTVFLAAQNVTIGPNNNNAEISMFPNPSGGNNTITMLKAGEFGRNQWRLIYEKNNLAPPNGPIEFAWEVGLNGPPLDPDFFSIGRYDFNIDFILVRPGLVMDNETLFTGLGERTPDAQLHVYHLDNLNDFENVPATIIGEYPGTIFDYGYLTVDQPSDDLNDNIARFRDGGSTQVAIDRGASTYQLTVFGDALASGGVWMNSDRQLKSNIRPLGDALKNLKNLKPSTFTFKRDSDQTKHLPEELQFGLIAQELSEVFPNLVRESDQLSEDSSSTGKILSVNYIGLIPVLIASLQELDENLAAKTREIESLREENASQQQQIDELRSMMEKLLAEQQEAENEGSSYVLPLEQKARLSQNYPNPFYENTIIQYFIPGDIRDARIQVSSADGKILGTVRILETGQGQVTIKAGTYPAGTYHYSLVLDGQVQETRQMVLTK